MRYFLCVILSLCSISAQAGMLLPDLEIGPSVRVLDIPHPLSVGLEARVAEGMIGFSLHKGLLPSFKVDQSDVKMDSFDIGVKIHPFKGSFYVGALMGDQKVSVEREETINGQSVHVKAEVKGKYFTPHVGWQWGLPGGLFLGMQLGWQINTEARTGVSTDQDNNPLVTSHPEYQKAKDDVIKTGDDLGNTSLPNVGLLQVGWLF